MHFLAKWTLTVLGVASLSHGQPTSEKKIMIDTDLFSDVDDTGALLLACTHPGADLLAVNINYPSSYTALALAGILGHYNHSHVPIGLKRPFTNETYFDDQTWFHGEYASKVGYNWRQGAALPWLDVSSTWDPVQLYRKTLSEQEDGSVTLISIGFLENLSGLLDSTADEYSPLSGVDLITAKVNELVIMGGQYPSGMEFNFFYYTPAATVHVVNNWPGPMVFSGNELGGNVFSGARLMIEGPENDPVKAAYQWYNGYGNKRNAWDPLTTLYGIQGLGDLFEFGNTGGHNYVYPNGSNAWQSTTKDQPQHYLRLAVSNTTAGETLDQLFLKGAWQFA